MSGAPSDWQHLARMFALIIYFLVGRSCLFIWRHRWSGETVVEDEVTPMRLYICRYVTSCISVCSDGADAARGWSGIVWYRRSQTCPALAACGERTRKGISLDIAGGSLTRTAAGGWQRWRYLAPIIYMYVTSNRCGAGG